MKDHYKILGVTAASTQDEIKRAYRMLAVKHHPDKNNGNRQSEELFKEISESYLVLSDISKRRAYDDRQYSQSSPQPEYRQTSKKVTPTTFLIIFRNIKERIFNAGGYVNEQALFRIIDKVLTSENISYLIKVHDVQTNRLIVDEILISSIFLRDASKMAIHRKLIRLAGQDAILYEKINVLTKKTDKPEDEMTEEEAVNAYMPFYIMLLVFVIVVLIVALG